MVFRKFISNRNEKKTVIKAYKPIYLGLAILPISKIKMYEYWYDEMKPKYGDKVKLCYMDTDSFIMQIKTEDFYKDITNDVEEKYDTSNYNCKRPLPIGKNKKVIGLMKDKLDGKIMKEFIGLKPKCYATLMDDDRVGKKLKGVRKCVIKRFAMFNNYEECAEQKKKMLRSQQTFKSDGHNVYTVETNKIALLFNNDKRLMSNDGITTYPYGISVGILCKQELLSKVSRKC